MAVGRQRDVERARLITGDTIYIDGGYDIMD
jgi:enoyl-[acyl-carrier-protein] reductase (NADH)